MSIAPGSSTPHDPHAAHDTRRPRGLDRTTLLLAVTALVCVGAVGAALVSQHMFGMEPCPWCILQRIVFIAIALACDVGLLWRSPLGRRVAGALMLALSACGAAAALWQHFKAAASASCNFTLADKVIVSMNLDGLLPEIFQPRASCADAAVNLLGVPYEFWSLLLFIAIGAVAARLVVRGR